MIMDKLNSLFTKEGFNKAFNETNTPDPSRMDKDVKTSCTGLTHLQNLPEESKYVNTDSKP